MPARGDGHLFRARPLGRIENGNVIASTAATIGCRSSTPDGKLSVMRGPGMATASSQPCDHLDKDAISTLADWNNASDPKLSRKGQFPE